MKNIELTSTTAQRIYKDYLKRVEKCLTILSKVDRQEMLMEINSHIFEGMQRFSDNNETDNLLTVLEKLGTPKEFLKPVIADKKIAQAVRTFNPKDVLQALLLNFKNGIIYSVFALLYLLLFVFVFFIAAKIIFPTKTGLFYLDDKFQAFGFIQNIDGMNDVLRFWFIPFVTLSAIIFYLLITLLLRFTKKK
jgi:uncharacterized membrane protein